MEIGSAKRLINPEPDVPHQNWGAQTHTRAEGLEADFYTRVCVLRQDEVTGVIVDVDACLFSREQSDALRAQVSIATGTAAANIRLSYTHSHAAPSVWGNLPEEGRQAATQYFDTIVAETVRASLEAVTTMEKVSLLTGSGSCKAAHNRRQPFEGQIIVGYNPEGVTSDRVLVIRCETADGRVKAHFVHYACHPTVLGFTNRLYSPDYPGVAKQFMDRMYGGVCLFLQGCAGDQGPGPHGFLDRVDEMRKLGNRLGLAAGAASWDMVAGSEVPVFRGIQQSGATLGIWDVHHRINESGFAVISGSCELPLKTIADPGILERRYERLNGQLERLRQSGADKETVRGVLYRTKRSFLALETSKAYYGKSSFPIEIQVFIIHDTVLIGVPLEPFIGVQHKLQSIYPSLNIGMSGYTNGWFGYLAERGDYAIGGYEVETSPFAEGAAEVLIDSICRLLNNQLGRS
ncbi:MAG: hypothetical protein K0R28_4799 [Paenibacillus sp.]|nr:hypothetical protein [Paenibacillus sp.]